MKKLILTLAVLVCATSSFAYYNSEIGRFVNRDPIAEEGGINLYVFVNNRPAMHTDVLGLQFGAGSVIGQATQSQVSAIRIKCAELNKVQDVNGRLCYNCVIEYDSATRNQVLKAMRSKNKYRYPTESKSGSVYIHVQGHGDEDRNRLLANGEMLSDTEMHRIADENLNWCKTYGCYADDNSNRLTTEANAYYKLLNDLNGYNTDRKCCEERTQIRLFFGPK